MVDHRRTAVLLNAANMAAFPIYPYAFIQIPAVARRAHIDVICEDLLGVSEAEWPKTIMRLEAEHQPCIFLITLRNTDSMVYADYHLAETEREAGGRYFPIDRTRALIKTIRSVSNLPVAVGGFGFSLLAKDLMPILRPDFGVFGGSDDFFLYFEDLIHGDYRHIANLLYFNGERLVANKRRYFPPAPDVEYTRQAIAQMMAFYDQFPTPGFLGAPLEIMRGCNHRCLFCSEPHVVGHRVQYRDLATILEEIDLLVESGITELYMISSELNPEGNEFVLQLADSITAFNARQPAARQVSWFGANYLLHFTADDYRRLVESGYTGGWFDISGLDDDNARAMQTPYRNGTLIGHVRAYAAVRREKLASDGDAAGKDGDAEDNQEVRWSMFLGNPATTMESIGKTIKVANEEGLAGLFDTCQIIRPLRVFDYERLSQRALSVTFSINEALERVPYQQTLPSFAYPPALLDQLGSEAAVESLFDHIGDTYLSTAYQNTREWSDFLSTHVPPVWPELPSAADAKQQVDEILQDCFSIYSEVLAAMALPASLAELDQATPYSLAAALYARGCSTAELMEVLCETGSIAADEAQRRLIEFFFEALLYRFNIQLLPAYRPLFYQGDDL